MTDPENHRKAAGRICDGIWCLVMSGFYDPALGLIPRLRQEIARAREAEG